MLASRGQIFARWLPCSCLRCIRFDADNCTRKQETPTLTRNEWLEKVNERDDGANAAGGADDVEDDDVPMDTGRRTHIELEPTFAPDTRTSDENVIERAEILGRKVKKGTNVFVYFDEPDVSQSLAIARALGPPRDIVSGGEVVSCARKTKSAKAKVVDIVLFKPASSGGQHRQDGDRLRTAAT